MSKLVTIYGGSGFLGRRIARRMAQAGWRVRIAVRRPNLAGPARVYGAVGQIVPVPCNVRDDLSVRAAMMDADAVINCVGILVRQGRNTFKSVHDDGAARIARLSAELGVARMVQVSAIGADSDSPSRYLASKGDGEVAVLASRPDAVILRPAVMFGPGDGFYNKFAALTRLSWPAFVAPGLRAVLQPVFVDDVAEAASLAAQGKAAPGIYELGGPEVMTLREVVDQVLAVTGRRRLVIGLPRWAGMIVAGGLDIVQMVSGGLVVNRLLTRDQLRTLGVPGKVAEGSRGLADLGIAATAPEAILPSYLWRFRKSGQYAVNKVSTSDLRDLE